jgi:hypothetical protein
MLSSHSNLGFMYFLIAHILKKRLDGAIQERDNQQISFEAFTAQQAEHVPKWKELVDAWESGRDKNNPYSQPQNGTLVYLRFTYVLLNTFQI